MKRNNFLLVVLLALLMIPAKVISQNLCPNPGFEQLTGCPLDDGDLVLAAPWTDTGTPAPLFSFCHVNGSPAGCNDVSVPNNFAGHSASHGGSCYSGFYTKRDTANRRTYVQAPLTSPMVGGTLYKVQAYVKRAGYSGFATNRIGCSFSTAALNQTSGQPIAVVPQKEFPNVIADTANWTLFSFYYTAVGGEAYITFGNFRNDAQTTKFQFLNPAPACTRMDASAFYYLDDVSVTTIVETLGVTGDTLICTGQTTALAGITNTSGWWSLASTPGDTIPSVNNAIAITPPTTTTYLWHGMQSTYPVTVTVVAPPSALLPNDTIICEGSTFTLDGTGPGYTYLWSTGDTSAQITVADSGKYILTVDNGACFDSDTFNLSLIPTPAVILEQNAVFCADNNFYIPLDAGMGESYFWSPTGDTTQIIIPKEAGIYMVTVTHGTGCTRSATAIVNESCPFAVFMPGAFSPNGDGKNDTYYGLGSNVLKYHIRIFNRWGQLLFESSSLGYEGAWDGKHNDNDVMQGLYVYQVSYDGLSPEGKKKSETRSGFIFLVR